MIETLTIAFLAAGLGITILSCCEDERLPGWTARTGAILLASALTHCAFVPGYEENYDSANDAQVAFHMIDSNAAETDWWVKDRSDANQITVSPSTGRALGLSVVGSLVLSPSLFMPQVADYQKAAIQFLNQTGRPGCRIVSAAKASQLQYQFGYDCPAASTPSSEPPRFKQ
ncbi:MAG TPA: hypothetical protein VKT73_10340 [Xanthobacteraceae bacterium]|nr:hypothetical protein [Xanthobacteraceae bacterium]